MAADASVITAWTALAAVVLSPVATIIAARWQNKTSVQVIDKQIAAQVVSVSRQKWIDELRASIAAFLAASGELQYRRDLGAGSGWQDDPRMERAVELRSTIALLVNPLESDHQRLLAAIDRRLNLLSVKSDPSVLKASQVAGAEITSIAQAVLKREWERVKQGELAVGSAATLRSQDA